MKCIQCNTDNTLRDRTDNHGNCKNCNHPFAFEPTSMGVPKITDPLFAKAISDISAENTLFFTHKQFFYLLDKRLGSKLNSPISCLSICIFLTFFFCIIRIPIFIIVEIPIFIIFSWQGSLSSKNSPRIRKIYARYLQLSGVVVLVLGIFYSLGLSKVPIAAFIFFLLGTAIGLLLIYVGTQRVAHQTSLSRTLTLAPSQINDWLNRWIQVNGSVSKMLPSPREESAALQVSPEVSAYSFDRVVICDSAAIAQLLIANNFHFENNCAVLSITGYPQSIFSTVLEMLRRNPELKVYALHDATPRGVGLVHHLRTSPNWFQNSHVTIYDLGLLPRQMFSSSSMFVLSSQESIQQATQMPVQVRQDLSAEELKWLELGNFVELESFTPRKLLQVVTQGIAKSRDPSSTDSLIVIDDSGSDVHVFAADSFG